MKFVSYSSTFVFISHTMNILLFQFRCNIFIDVRIIQEMPGSVANGTHCITTLLQKAIKSPLHADPFASFPLSIIFLFNFLPVLTV